jgi:hypothetical protein
MGELTESVPITVGIRATGAGTREDRCLCVAWPLRLRFEVEEPEGRGVSLFYGDRLITRRKMSRDLLDSGRLTEALSWPVIVAFEGYLEVGHVGGTFYLITDCEEDPEWIDIGPHIRFQAHFRYPGEPIREIADVLLERLFGVPDEEVERLLASIEPGEPGPRAQYEGEIR